MTYLVLLSFLLYVWLTSILPALSREKVTDQTKKITEQLPFISDTVGPDRASAIIQPADAFNVRIEIIRAAEKSIDLVVDKLIDSESTQALLGELSAAADRGVQVNVMVNGLTYLLFRNQQYMKALNHHKNITCRIYNPVNLLHPSRMQFFLHDKILFVDGKYLLLGGRNMDERHFRPVDYKKAYAYDVECFVLKTNKDEAGESVMDEVQVYLDRLYRYKYTKKLAVQGNLDYLKKIKRVKANYPKSNPQFYDKKLAEFVEETVPANKITLLHNPVNAHKKEPILGYQLQFLAFKATEEVVLQTPHVTGNKAIIRALKELSKRVEVTVQTNSAASTPNLFAFSNYYGYRKKLIQTGANFYEFQSEHSLHNNAFIVDNRLAGIGSFNLSDRSLYINSESMVIVDSEEFARKFKEDVDMFKTQSLKVGLDNEYVESDKVEEIDISFAKKVLLFVNFYLLRAIQIFF